MRHLCLLLLSLTACCLLTNGEQRCSPDCRSWSPHRVSRLQSLEGTRLELMRQDIYHAYALIQAQIGNSSAMSTFSVTPHLVCLAESPNLAPLPSALVRARAAEHSVGLRPLKRIYELLRSQSNTNMLHEPLKVPTGLLRGFEPAQMGVQRVPHRRVEARVRASRTPAGQSHGSKEADGTMATERPLQECALKVPI